MSIIIEASRVAFCFTSSRVIKSLGANPVSGGRPAKDNITSIVDAERAGVFDQEVEICDIFVVDIAIKAINMAVVIIIYNMKLKRESRGLNFKMTTIQPK